MTSAEVVRKFRKDIPLKHQTSMDTKIAWLWHQRFGTVQTIYNETNDVETKTVCTIFLQAIMAKDLPSIKLLLDRMEGGAIVDHEVLDRAGARQPQEFMPF